MNCPTWVADGGHHLQELGIGIADLAAEKFEHAHYPAPERDREGGVEPCVRGKFRPLELRSERHVRYAYGCRSTMLARGAHADAGRPRQLRAGLR